MSQAVGGGGQDLRAGAEVFPPIGACRLFQLLGCSRPLVGTCCSPGREDRFSLALCPSVLQPLSTLSMGTSSDVRFP